MFRMSSNFGEIGQRTIKLSALECLKTTPIDLYWGKTVSPFFLGCFCPIILILAGNEEINKSLEDFECWPNLTTHYGVSCP